MKEKEMVTEKKNYVYERMLCCNSLLLCGNRTKSKRESKRAKGKTQGCRKANEFRGWRIEKRSKARKKYGRQKISLANGYSHEMEHRRRCVECLFCCCCFNSKRFSAKVKFKCRKKWNASLSIVSLYLNLLCVEFGDYAYPGNWMDFEINSFLVAIQSKHTSTRTHIKSKRCWLDFQTNLLFSASHERNR